jgi:hypothetical protein
MARILMVAVGEPARLGAQHATPATPAAASTPVPPQATIGTPTVSAPCGPLLGLGDESVACVIFVQTLADVQAVDIILDDTPAITGLPFGGTSGFVPLPAGTYDLRITVAGNSASVVAELPNVTVEAGRADEIIIVGQQADSTAAVETLPVDLSPVADGEARLRVYHAIADGPALDIAVASGGEIVVPGVAPLSATEYRSVPAGVALEARLAGSETVFVDLGTRTLVPNTVVSLFIVGTADGPATSIVVPVVITLSGPLPVATPSS